MTDIAREGSRSPQGGELLTLAGKDYCKPAGDCSHYTDHKRKTVDQARPCRLCTHRTHRPTASTPPGATKRRSSTLTTVMAEDP